MTMVFEHVFLTLLHGYNRMILEIEQVEYFWSWNSSVDYVTGVAQLLSTPDGPEGPEFIRFLKD